LQQQTLFPGDSKGVEEQAHGNSKVKTIKGDHTLEKVEVESVFDHDGPHSFEHIGCRESPGDRLQRIRQYRYQIIII